MKRKRDSSQYDVLIGQQIRALRQARGWTLQELARLVGIGHPQLSRIENGRASVTVETLRRLAVAFGVMPGDLLPPDPGGQARFGPYGAAWHLALGSEYAGLVSRQRQLAEELSAFAQKLTQAHLLRAVDPCSGIESLPVLRPALSA